MTTERIARVAYEVNKAYCEAIGDRSQLPWDQAHEWQKTSVIKGVEMHLINPDATPEQSHESWLKEKSENGWKYGPVKDAEKKEHPCFLPYSELPEKDKVKDHLFRQVVHSLAPFLNDGEQGNLAITDQKSQSFGMKAVGITFNPSKFPEVDTIKWHSATLIDFLNDLRTANEDGEAKAQYTLAIRKIQEGQMWGVKAATWSL